MEKHQYLMDEASMDLGAHIIQNNVARSLEDASDWERFQLHIEIREQSDDLVTSRRCEMLRICLDNRGEEPVELNDIFIDVFPHITEHVADGLFSRVAQHGDCYLCFPAGDCSKQMVILPYGGTHFMRGEALSSRSCFRCSIYDSDQSGEDRHPKQSDKRAGCETILEPGEHREWTILCSEAHTDSQIASMLIERGYTPLEIGYGFNRMRTIAHHFADAQASVQVCSQLVNESLCATLLDGRLSSLQAISGSIEAIDPERTFGDVAVELEGGETISTVGPNAFSGENGSLNVYGANVRISVRFKLVGGLLRYAIALTNMSREAVTVIDVRVPFSLNSSMDWNVSADQRMIRHSQVAGDNSFIVGTPCDGKPPYLLCTPCDGTPWELFDTQGISQDDDIYTIHICGHASAARAKNSPGHRLRVPVSSLSLQPGESKEYAFDFQWTQGYDDVRQRLVDSGKIDVRILPGLTVPRDQDALVLLRGKYEKVLVEAEYPDDTTIEEVRHETDCGDRRISSILLRIHMDHLGENMLKIHYGNQRIGCLELFSTLPIADVIDSRARYITKCQVRDEDVWYDGLFRERNSLSGVMVDPDHHDELPWSKRYAIASDDPGLARPAFLSSKNVERPDIDEIKALNRYCERFVWGGLQRTDYEEYPYGVYGVPDWRECRSGQNLNANEQLHMWRLYDYPHVALLWFNMYRIAQNYPEDVAQEPQEYLRRAYGTFLAMYQYPYEIEQSYGWMKQPSFWSPYKTGFYNELAIMDVIKALHDEHMQVEAKRLEFHWDHKADSFIRGSSDVFGSEMAFDTTGFETTQALVDWAREHAPTVWNTDVRSLLTYTPGQIESFDVHQRSSNIACRGFLENAYYLTGSDIRSDSSRYTLSYMSQMGGWSLMQDALYADGSPFELLRLAYTSLLSSWSLVNAGDELSDYGYWFHGEENDGASSGGFEPLPASRTWLGQMAWRGVWRYGSETDLGFCGYLRGAVTVLADDPSFGRVVYGGVANLRQQDPSSPRCTDIVPLDGVSRRFHMIFSAEERIHVLVNGATINQVSLVEQLHRDDLKVGRLRIGILPDRSGDVHMRVFSHHDAFTLTYRDTCARFLNVHLEGAASSFVEVDIERDTSC